MSRKFGGMAGPALPCAGGFSDQPAALMQAFAILDGIGDGTAD